MRDGEQLERNGTRADTAVERLAALFALAEVSDPKRALTFQREWVAVALITWLARGTEAAELRRCIER